MPGLPAEVTLYSFCSLKRGAVARVATQLALRVAIPLALGVATQLALGVAIQLALRVAIQLALRVARLRHLELPYSWHLELPDLGTVTEQSVLCSLCFILRHTVAPEETHLHGLFQYEVLSSKPWVMMNAILDIMGTVTFHLTSPADALTSSPTRLQEVMELGVTLITLLTLGHWWFPKCR